MANSTDRDFKFYHYNPSMAAAVIFIVMFLSTTSLHLYQLLRTRTWFIVPMLVGGFFEWIGYVGRAISSQQTPNWTLGPFIIQTLLILVAPALFAATIYMELGRIITLADAEAHILIKKKWLTKVFVGGDIISFLLQAGGGGLEASSTASAISNGSHLVVGGLFVQLCFFGFFIGVAALFDVKMHKVSATRIQHDIPWRKHLIVLYSASTLIMVRSIFRVVEYLQGFNGYLLSHEIYLYIFDAVLMLILLVVFNVMHPSEVVALLNGGKAMRQGWKMREITRYHEGVMSDSL